LRKIYIPNYDDVDKEKDIASCEHTYGNKIKVPQ